jgi:hypothetical protein
VRWFLASLLLVCALPARAQPLEPTPLPEFSPDGPVMEEGEPLPPLLPQADPPVTPLLQRWSDADEQTLTAMRGGFGVCTAATLPVRLIPNVGLLISMSIEWACILPTAVNVDHVQRGHGTRRSYLWQALASLVVTKVWRDFTQLPGLLNILALTTGVTLGTLGALVASVVALTLAVVAPVAPGRWLGTLGPLVLAWLPLAVSGLLSFSALVFLVMEVLRDSVADVLFMGMYGLLSGQWPEPESQWRDQRREWMRPRLNVVERTWLLASVAAGTTPDFRWWHLVPVVGPAVKAWDRHKALKRNVHRLSQDDLREPQHDHELVDFSIAVLCALEGSVGVLAHLATAASLGLLVLGLSAGMVERVPRLRGPVTSVVAVGSAGLAVLAAQVALFLVVLREAPTALNPVVIPLAYGLWPPLGFFPERE